MSALPKLSRKDEADLEGFFRKRVRLVGGYLIKLAPTERGIPDRLVFFPGGRMFLVELKLPGEEPSPIQRVWHTRMSEQYGIRVHVLSGEDEIVRWLRAVVSATDPTSKPGRRPARRVG